MRRLAGVQQAWLPQHLAAQQLSRCLQDCSRPVYHIISCWNLLTPAQCIRNASSRAPNSAACSTQQCNTPSDGCGGLPIGTTSRHSHSRWQQQQHRPPRPIAAAAAAAAAAQTSLQGSPQRLLPSWGVSRCAHTAAVTSMREPPGSAVEGLYARSRSGHESHSSSRSSRSNNSNSKSSRSSSDSRHGDSIGRLHQPLFQQRSSRYGDSHTGAETAGAAAGGAIGAAAATHGCQNAGAQVQLATERTTDGQADASDSEADGYRVVDPTDLRSPEQWYPAARAMAPRSLIAHLGPTNSGKTHAALAALAAAPTGVYCGPLRLLACEVADRLNTMGVPCNLVTGQEVRRVKGARHTACTVEMADLASRVQVAVLDEVQMISDRARGWSWTRVLLGLPAEQLHLCGDPAAAGLLEQLSAHCGDTLSITRHRRLAPLVVQADPLEGLHQVQDGDCVVAFGRKTLHRLRKRILGYMSPVDTHSSSGSSSESDSEGLTDCDATKGEGGGWYSNSCSSSGSDSDASSLTTAEQQQQRQQRRLRQQQQQEAEQVAAARACQGVGMVYGALPPESRRTQAALFNARGDVWPRTSVLVASDAVGMGLNLNIRRIVFTTLHKYDGVETRPLSASEIKQIAGRAGRYASGHAEGYVSVLNPDDLPLLRQALATATPSITQACLLPMFEQLEQFALDLQHHNAQTPQHGDLDDDSSSWDLGRRRRPPLRFHKLLRAFVAASRLSGSYFLADMKNMLALAKLLRHLEPHLSLEDMYTLCISPASADDGPVVQALLHISASYAYDHHVTPDCITLPCPVEPPRSAAEMKVAEELFRVYDLYLWLYDRLGPPGVFRGRRQVLQQRQQVAELIDVALQRMGGVGGPHQAVSAA